MASSKTGECFICEKSLDSGTVTIVKEKGVNTLLLSSEKRGNNEHKQFLKDLKQVTVHLACQKSYTSATNIAAAIRRSNRPSVPRLTRSTSTPRDIPTFDFGNRCFICTEEITEKFLEIQKRLSASKRNNVYEVRKPGVKYTVLNALQNRTDEWARSIIDRLENVMDLVARNARYHSFCMKKLYNRQPVIEKKVGERTDRAEKAMEPIYEYLTENSDECQFSLNDLISKIEGD